MYCLAGKKYLAGITAAVLLAAAAFVYAGINDDAAEIESVRKDGIVTITSAQKPEKSMYNVIIDDTSYGAFSVIDVLPVKDKGVLRYRAIVRYEQLPGTVRELRTGQIIQLKELKKTVPFSFIKDKPAGIISLLKAESSISPDNRAMVLIPEGRFYFGSDNGDPDEYPRSIEYLDAYYIDKNEVTNKDFLMYVDAVKAAYPKSWGGVFPSGDKDLPVVVSFHEARAYAQWAGKRLPTEKEWEKAAAGSLDSIVVNTPDGYYVIKKQTMYPWGDDFISNRCNCLLANSETALKHSASVFSGKGLLPANADKKEFISAFGLNHMAGNIQEWTDSWYEAYPGNKVKNHRFGNKFKVIRGGSWYSSSHAVRVTAREIGGIPNLDDDVIAGFRCVRNPAEADRVQ